MKKEEFEKLKQIFFSKLEKKTGWGRNEIKRVWLESVTEFLLTQNETYKTKKPQSYLLYSD